MRFTCRVDVLARLDELDLDLLDGTLTNEERDRIRGEMEELESDLWRLDLDERDDFFDLGLIP